jgi:hypothetical protein
VASDYPIWLKARLVLLPKFFHVKKILHRGRGELNMADNQELIPVDNVIAELRRKLPGRVTMVSYEGLKFAIQSGVDVWEHWRTDSFREVIRDIGTPEQKQRLEAILTANRSTR